MSIYTYIYKYIFPSFFSVWLTAVVFVFLPSNLDLMIEEISLQLFRVRFTCERGPHLVRLMKGTERQLNSIDIQIDGSLHPNSAW